ncbi:Hsp20 family protein [Sneathiella chungangensis]|uniref:Hsp20 family protein n=1 Tax=Sneathiella chungangensis TaxID=1418234 RepID=A0A845MLS8_9PROT|nr:Hsp20/alpha crystallin family protein [Sneathiella chungangensis]MZR24322.1 Hsp20 family protein [Sneathiella chungangensis]
MSRKISVHRNTDWWPDVFEPFRSFGYRVQDFFSPTAEAGSTENDYDISMELPGVKEKDIEISLDDNVLTIKGEKHSEKEKKGKTFYFSERAYGSFERTFRLPANVDSNKIEADFEDGVLRIKMPKSKEISTSTKKIAIGKKG